MKYAVDLHIHSALSPCADNDMTPNNIIEMALLKGLDIIAITDHNSGANLQAFDECAEKRGLMLVPGVEVETCEEIHLLCLLPDLDSAGELCRHVYGALPDVRNKEEIFGEQFVLDAGDNIIRTEKKMLITATSLSVEQVILMTKSLGGAALPAHVDRQSYSMLSNFGEIPKGLGIGYLEISRDCDPDSFRAGRPELNGFGIIRSSDAHTLKDILERECFLELDELSVKALIRCLST